MSRNQNVPNKAAARKGVVIIKGSKSR